MGAALRCSICGTDWPYDRPRYWRCPECVHRTDAIMDGEPLDDKEARRRKLYAEFERYYEERDSA